MRPACCRPNKLTQRSGSNVGKKMPVLPSIMRQVYFDGAGAPDVIRIGEAPLPAIAPGKVLIEVVAAGINRPDCIQRAGNYPPPPSESAIPGMEVAGRIVALGDGVTGFKEGDEVCALLGSGGYAEYALAEAGLCLPKPQGLSLIEAAGLPETAFTVYDNVFTRGKLKAGEIFLVHGGSSGIGTTAIQLAKAFGATVITTAGSPEKCAFCKALGADHAIDYKTQDFAAEIKTITEKKGVNVILDMVGGSYIAKNISIMATDGRLVQIAFLQSSKAESVDFMPMMLRRLTLTGSTLRARTLAQKTEVAAAVREHVWPLIEAGKVKPIVHATFHLEEARHAHELMESSAHIGKILLLTGK
jgi:putative PIG3 family NAD(P)H quinone oxidoreductase